MKESNKSIMVVTILVASIIGAVGILSDTAATDGGTIVVNDADGMMDAVASAQDGDVITLGDDLVFSPLYAMENNIDKLIPLMTVDDDIRLDLNGHKISWNQEDLVDAEILYTLCFFSITGDANIVLYGDGVIDVEAGYNNSYGINILGGNLSVLDGTYTAATSAIQVTEGVLDIYSGTFIQAETIAEAAPNYAKYIINCIDANFKDGTAVINVYGGSHGFDPSATPEGSDTTYAADGYVSALDESTGLYAVAPDVEAVSVGDERFASLVEAAGYAKAAGIDKVTLLQDLDLTDAGVIDVSGLTVDLGQKTIFNDNSTNAPTMVMQGTDVILTNGTFDSKGSSYGLFIGDEGVTDSVLVTGITVNGGINVYNATDVTIEDTVVHGTNYYAVWCDENGHVTINSGSYDTQGIKTNAILGISKTDSSMEVYNGSFTVNENGRLVLEGSTSDAFNDPVIYGGTFNVAVDQTYCAPGYTSVDRGDGTYTVTQVQTSSTLTVSDREPSVGDEITAEFEIEGISAEGAVFEWTFNDEMIAGVTGDTYSFTAERSGTLVVSVTIDVYGLEKTFSGSADIKVTVPTTPEDPDEGETTVTIDKDGNTVTETTRPDGSSTVTTEKPPVKEDGNTVTETIVKDTDSDGSTTTITETKYESDSATTTVTEVEDASGNTTVQSQTSVTVDETQDVAVVDKEAITAAIEHMVSIVNDTTAEKVVTVETSKEQVTLPANISDVTDAGATLEVVSNIGTVKVDSDVVETLVSDGKDVTITQKDADTAEMNASQQQAVGDNRVIELTASNDDRDFHQLGGTVEVVVRNYVLPDGVDADSVVVFYVDDNGRLSQKETFYDAVTGLLRFWTDHFSYYVIGNTSMIAQDQPDDRPVNPGWNPGQDDDVWIPPTVVVEESGSQSGTTEIVACAAAAVVAALMAAFLIIERRKS